MIGLDIWGTAIVMISGGIVGFLIYYHISRIIIISTRHLKPFAKIVLPFHLQTIIIITNTDKNYGVKTKKYLHVKTDYS